MATSANDLNPFRFSKPVQIAELIDREDEVSLLVRLAQGNHNSRLTAPRRYGKTTLLKRVREVLDKDGYAVVYVNFYGLLSVQEAAGRIERGYRSSLHGPVRNFVVGAMRTLKPRAKIPGTGVTLAPNLEASELGERITWLLNLPQKIMAKHGMQTVVIFDEFQEVLRTKPPLDGLIRSVIEQHEEEASYIFAGSHPGMMAELFAKKSRPFYGQARSVVLPPLPGEPLAEYIADRFTRTNRDTGDALDHLLETARGHPQRAMVLAHFLWEQTPEAETADEIAWQRALDDTYFELRDEFMEVWNGLSDAKKRTLVALATDSTVILAKATLDALQIARSTAIDARESLLKEGILEGADEQTRLVDPLLRLWLIHGRLGLSDSDADGETS